ncbi:rhoptry kinase family protein [Cyclospora cayetanensis]|uniref:Rhoptry kinase family protein n=1 Tax=Cyclospora cayetanensis TaxID=88456 RepID=A0A1D3D182_9EIME|nr:rhoptry kinase family protein [Cyclospora cayetanensis]
MESSPTSTSFDTTTSTVPEALSSQGEENAPFRWEVDDEHPHAATNNSVDASTDVCDKLRITFIVACLFLGIAFGFTYLARSKRMPTSTFLPVEKASGGTISGSIGSASTITGDTQSSVIIRDSSFSSIGPNFETYALNVPLETDAGSREVVEPSSPDNAAIVQQLPVKAFIPSSVEDWNLPATSTIESALSRTHAEGKELLSKMLKEANSSISEQAQQTSAILPAVAMYLTQGATQNIKGVSINLINILPFSTLPDGLEDRMKFTVTRVLEEGGFRSVVEICDDRGRYFALSFLTVDSTSSDPTQVAVDVQKAFELELEVITQACAQAPAEHTAQQRGIAVPLFTAEIVGMPKFSSVGTSCLYNRVHIMERLYGDLGHLVNSRTPISFGAKEYIAQRLLLQVLRLQEAQVSHNNLKWTNCFMQPDGSFLLGDFGSSSIFGQRLHPLASVTPLYTDPLLLKEFYSFAIFPSSDLAKPNPKSDLWSLGMLLYSLFTDGELPFHLQRERDSLRQVYITHYILMSRKTSIEALEQRLQSKEVPRRWIRLISKLLEPTRISRISGKDISLEFSDLFQ